MFSIFQLRKMPEEIRPLALAEERIDTNESTAIQEIVVMSRKTMTMSDGSSVYYCRNSALRLAKNVLLHFMRADYSIPIL